MYIIVSIILIAIILLVLSAERNRKESYSRAIETIAKQNGWVPSDVKTNLEKELIDKAYSKVELKQIIEELDIYSKATYDFNKNDDLYNSSRVIVKVYKNYLKRM